MPELNIGRAGVSNCLLAEHVYVFCGMTENRKRLCSIERLRIVAYEPIINTVTAWELI